ncbi:hypothetical protein GH733_017498 [Mirounga leonina]|nr:hypothetical protein GH733_017498 [Mirounga leonina]
MGLLTGDTLGSLAVAVAIFLLLMDFQNTLCYFGQVTKLRRGFGNVFSLQLVWTPVVVLSGLDAVREALVYHSEDTAHRPPMRVCEPPGFRPPSQGKRRMGADRGLAGTGPASPAPTCDSGALPARVARAAALLRVHPAQLRPGKKSLEQWATEEASGLCEAFADHAGGSCG